MTFFQGAVLEYLASLTLISLIWSIINYKISELIYFFIIFAPLVLLYHFLREFISSSGYFSVGCSHLYSGSWSILSMHVRCHGFRVVCWSSFVPFPVQPVAAQKQTDPAFRLQICRRSTRSYFCSRAPESRMRGSSVSRLRVMRLGILVMRRLSTTISVSNVFCSTTLWISCTYRFGSITTASLNLRIIAFSSAGNLIHWYGPFEMLFLYFA